MEELGEDGLAEAIGPPNALLHRGLEAQDGALLDVGGGVHTGGHDEKGDKSILDVLLALGKIGGRGLALNDDSATTEGAEDDCVARVLA